jgi:hypothetical protein
MEVLMEHRGRYFQLKSHHGKVIEWGNVMLTPQSQSLVIGRGPGMFIWNRPLAVILEQDGKLERIPIFDITRIAQLGIFLVGITVSIIGFFRIVKKGR